MYFVSLIHVFQPSYLTGQSLFLKRTVGGDGDYRFEISFGFINGADDVNLPP